MIRKTRCNIGGVGIAAIGLAAVAAPAFAGDTLTTLASFNGTDGAGPYSSAGLTLSGGTLYGTTERGGSSGYGTVFALPVTGGTPTTLASFNVTNGAWPDAGVTLSGGTLYGTTRQGGADGYGTVFSVPVTGGPVTTLATLNGSNDGAYPIAGVTVSGGTLYGTTWKGGAGGYGTVFSVPVTGGTPTALVTFNGGDGAYPMAGMTLSGGTLYGTTRRGGAYGDGTVFSIPVTGGTATTLVSFNNTNGSGPEAGLTVSNGTLYGTAAYGGTGGVGTVSSSIVGTSKVSYSLSNGSDGTVFSVPITGGTPTTLASFSSFVGGGPGESGVIPSGSTLYGTTDAGGAYGYGTLFSLPITGGTPTTLLSFNTGSSSGPTYYGNLTLSGNTLFGTAYQGGAHGDGTVFAVTIPEPAALALMAIAGAGILLLRKQRSDAESV